MSVRMPAQEPVVLLLGPQLGAVSGVSAHLQTLLDSRLAKTFVLKHFQVGSEGQGESRAGRLLRIIRSPVALAAAIRRHRPMLVHLNTSLNVNAFWRDLLYMIVARLHGIRVLYQVHGGALPGAFFGSSRLCRTLLRKILATPHTVVVLAESELAAYREFVPTQRIVLIPNAIDCAPYLALQRRTGADEPLQLIYLGRLAREKGLYELLQGLALARAENVPVRLTIVGSGAEQAQLRQAVTELQLDDTVSFAGALFGAAKLQLLAAADVLVLPSYSEGLPCAVLEGMAAGAAVIATGVGAIPDVVNDGQHGLLVPPRDARAIAAAIATLASDRVTLARMSTACRNRIAAAHSLERLAHNFGELYADLLEMDAVRSRVAPGAG